MQKFVSAIFKVKSDIERKLMKHIITTEKSNTLLNNSNLKSSNINTVLYGTENTPSFFRSKTMNNLLSVLKDIESSTTFKRRIRVSVACLHILSRFRDLFPIFLNSYHR